MIVVTDTTDKKLTSVVQAIGETLKKYFDVRRERAMLKLKHDKKVAKATAKFQEADEPLGKLEAELLLELRALIIPNKMILLSGKLKSFATAFGSVSFAHKTEAYRVTDPKGFEQKARKERRLTLLGKFVRTWKPDAKKIDKWLRTDPYAVKRYEPFVEKVGGYDELFVQPNDVYLTDYDPNRLTARSVNLGPALEDAKDDN